MVGLGDGNKQNRTMMSTGTSQRADFQHPRIQLAECKFSCMTLADSERTYHDQQMLSSNAFNLKVH